MQTIEAIKPSIRRNFYGVQPINKIRIGELRPIFPDSYRLITGRTVRLKQTQEPKNLSLVCLSSFSELNGSRLYMLETEKINVLLKELNMRLFSFAANYLLGLMRDWPQDFMPPELKDKKTIAIGPDIPGVVFKDEGDEHKCSCFLGVEIRRGERKLDLFCTGRILDGSIAFLAENIPPQAQADKFA